MNNGLLLAILVVAASYGVVAVIAFETWAAVFTTQIDIAANIANDIGSPARIAKIQDMVRAQSEKMQNLRE